MADTFTRTIAGRDVEFRAARPAQLSAYMRVRERYIVQYQALKDTEDTAEKAQAMEDLYAKFENNELDLMISLLVNPDDQEFLDRAMVRGEITIADLISQLFGVGDQPDDDAEPVAKVKESKPKKAARLPKGARTANGTRTQR